MSKKTQTVIPAGSLLTVTTGEYSDYIICGVFRAVKSLNIHALVEEYLTERPQQKEQYRFNKTEFLGWLTQTELIEAVECFECYISEWSYHKTSVVELKNG